jgi:hypothetical protein
VTHAINDFRYIQRKSDCVRQDMRDRAVSDAMSDRGEWRAKTRYVDPK